MCGLFGIAGPGINKQDIEVLNELMHVSAMRGLDATGLASGKAYQPHDVNLFKVGGDFIYWRYMLANDKNEEFVDKLFSINNSYFIGHCRKRTLGENTNKAAHPFDFPNLVGTHNGTILWPKESTEGFLSDSHQFYSLLNDKKGDLQAVVDKTAWGDSMALVWFDKKKRSLNFYRNSMRTLYYILHPTRSVMYWASEEGMLRFVAARNSIKYETMWYFKPGYLYSVKPGSISPTAAKELWESVDPITMPEKIVNSSSSAMGETEADLCDIPWLERRPNNVNPTIN